MQASVVWIPKYRKKGIYVGLRKYLGELMRALGKVDKLPG